MDEISKLRDDEVPMPMSDAQLIAHQKQQIEALHKCLELADKRAEQCAAARMRLHALVTHLTGLVAKP